MSGLVSLVGAGPGDPELLTVRAVRRLAEAAVVLHDALIDPRVLALAAQARLIDVGKRAAGKQTEQAVIERLLVQLGRGGQRVVRLKGGDPFVFGRGGEEALALARAGVPFEIVPGLSSALSGPARRPLRSGDSRRTRNRPAAPRPCEPTRIRSAPQSRARSMASALGEPTGVSVRTSSCGARARILSTAAAASAVARATSSSRIRP